MPELDHTPTHIDCPACDAARDEVIFAAGLRRLQRAIDLAVEAHGQQRDKAGEPYLWHVLRVGTSLLPDVDAAIVGVLHDVLEDCSRHFRPRVERILGEDLFGTLLLLTRDEYYPYEAYIERIATAPGPAGTLARKVKRADLSDNLGPDRLAQLPPEEQQRLRTKYHRAISKLGPSALSVTQSSMD